MKRLGDVRILMYSHDTFGLGHFRRCRAIAHAIVEQFKGVSVVIISGSQIAGAFDFRARVDFVKIPSVIKLYNGEYDSISDHISIDEILMMRKQIIQRTAEVFKPDIFITDKEPLGLRGELEPTLEMLSRTVTRVILGLRDVMDSPSAMQRDWDKDHTLDKIMRFYDRVWIYGPENFWQPMTGLDVEEKLLDRCLYTGFLRRELSTMQQIELHHIPEKFILVTTGGGGDGYTLLEQVLAARELDISSDYPLLMVLGPFMKSEYRERIRLHASALPNITVFDFESRMELLLKRATAVVGMCGYNTFCEVLSFDKKALFVPRVHPREEQYIRASRARELGLCEMLTPEEASVPKVLAQKLNSLPNLDKPSRVLEDSYLEGLETICRDIENLINAKARLSNGKPQDHFVESTIN